MTSRHLLTAFIALSLSACDHDDDPASTDGTDTPATQDVALQFDAVVDGVSARCGEDLPAMGTADTPTRLQDLRFYVSNVALLADDGTEVPVTLTEDGTWQRDVVALVDLEDGSAECGNSGNSLLNDLVQGTVPEGTYTGVAFDLGVPFEHNHLDVATAAPPLNTPSLYWAWQSGYKFMRVDLLNDQEAPMNNWFTHLGSTGCMSDAAGRPPEEPCSKPNLARIRLTDVDPAADVIALDLTALYEASDLSSNTPDTPAGCMSNPAEPEDCDDVFTSLGLSFETGACVDDCADQVAFTVLP